MQTIEPSAKVRAAGWYGDRFVHQFLATMLAVKRRGKPSLALLCLLVLFCGSTLAAHGSLAGGCAYPTFKVTKVHSTTMQIRWSPLQQDVRLKHCHVSLTIPTFHPRYISQCNPALHSHLITGLQANTTYRVCLLLGCENSKGQNNPSCKEVITKPPGHDVTNFIPLHWQSIIATATATTLISSILGICIYKCCDRGKIYLRPKYLIRRRRGQQNNQDPLMGREIPTIVVGDQGRPGQPGDSHQANSCPLLNRQAGGLSTLREEPEYESASPVMSRAAHKKANKDFLHPEEHHYEAASPVLGRAAKTIAEVSADPGYETTEGWDKSGYANANQVQDNNNSLLPPSDTHTYAVASPVMPRAHLESRLHASCPSSLGMHHMNNLSPPEGHYEAATPVMPRANLAQRAHGMESDHGPVQQAPHTSAPSLSVPTIHYEAASPVLPRARMEIEHMENSQKSLNSELSQGQSGHLCPSLTYDYQVATPVIPRKANRLGRENGHASENNMGVM